MSDQSQTQSNPSEFEREAASASRGVIAEVIGFLKHNKKWWLLPIIVAAILVSALVTLSGTAVAPFIYTLF